MIIGLKYKFKQFWLVFKADWEPKGVFCLALGLDLLSGFFVNLFMEKMKQLKKNIYQATKSQSSWVNVGAHVAWHLWQTKQ